MHTSPPIHTHHLPHPSPPSASSPHDNSLTARLCPPRPALDAPKPTLAYLGTIPVMLGVVCVSVAREREKRAAAVAAKERLIA